MIPFKPDPLDALLYALGLRLGKLDIIDKDATIEFSSPTMVRTFVMQNGRFRQTDKRASKPDLSIAFLDSFAGAKLLAKGDAVAFMQAIQGGKVRITGDYALILWFIKLSQKATTLPEKLQPLADTAKQKLKRATPYIAQVKKILQRVRGK